MEVNTSNIPMKEIIIRHIAKHKNVVDDKIIPESVISAVVAHQFESASNALALNNSVEISGFGKFVYSEKRAAKKLVFFENMLVCYTDKLNDENTSLQERRTLQMKITTTLANIKAIKPKLKSNE